LKDEPAYLRRGCFAESHLFYIELVNKPEIDHFVSKWVYPCEEIPEEFQIDDLSVLVSGNILRDGKGNPCFPSQPNIRIAPTNIFKLQTIKIGGIVMKTIKHITAGIFIFCGIVCFGISCENEKPMDSCAPPPGLEVIDESNSIDWENYNSVRIVYINNELDCSSPKIAINNGKTIKIYGWLMIKDGILYIKQDSLYYTYTIPIYSTPEIQTFLENCDLTKKCYLKGELNLENTRNYGKGAWCCMFSARIILKEITDVYFEEE